nr:MAG TPA: hypothetical protein [Caudoviricetes sp.]
MRLLRLMRDAKHLITQKKTRQQPKKQNSISHSKRTNRT